MGGFFDYLNRRFGGEQQLGLMAQQQALLERIRQHLELARPFLERYSGIEAELTALMEAGQAEQVERLLRDLPEHLRTVDRQMEEVRRAEVLVPSAEVGKEAYYDYCLHSLKTNQWAQATHRQAEVLERIRRVNAEELARRERLAQEEAHRERLLQEKNRLENIPELVFFKGILAECCEKVDREGIDAARNMSDRILPELHDLKESLGTLLRRTDLPASVKMRVPDLWNYCVSSLRSSGLRDAKNRCLTLGNEASNYRHRQATERQRVENHPLVRSCEGVRRELEGRIDRGEFDGEGWSFQVIANQLDGLKKWQDFLNRVTLATPEIARRRAELTRYCQQQMSCGEITSAAQLYVNLYTEHLSVLVNTDGVLAPFVGVKRELLELLQANRCTEADALLRRVHQPLSALTRTLDAATRQATAQHSSHAREIHSFRQYCETQMTELEIEESQSRANSFSSMLASEKQDIDRRRQQEEDRRKKVMWMWVYIGLGVIGVALLAGFVWYLVEEVLDTWWKTAIAITVGVGIIYAVIKELF